MRPDGNYLLVELENGRLVYLNQNFKIIDENNNSKDKPIEEISNFDKVTSKFKNMEDLKLAMIPFLPVNQNIKTIKRINLHNNKDQGFDGNLVYSDDLLIIENNQEFVKFFKEIVITRSGLIDTANLLKDNNEGNYIGNEASIVIESWNQYLKYVEILNSCNEEIKDNSIEKENNFNYEPTDKEIQDYIDMAGRNAEYMPLRVAKIDLIEIARADYDRDIAKKEKDKIQAIKKDIERATLEIKNNRELIKKAMNSIVVVCQKNYPLKRGLVLWAKNRTVKEKEKSEEITNNPIEYIEDIKKYIEDNNLEALAIHIRLLFDDYLKEESEQVFIEIKKEAKELGYNPNKKTR